MRRESLVRVRAITGASVNPWVASRRSEGQVNSVKTRPGQCYTFSTPYLMLALTSLQVFGGEPRSRPVASPHAPRRRGRRLPLASSHSADATNGGSHAAVPQHSGPFPGGGRSPRARPAYQMPGPRDHPPCRSFHSAAHPTGVFTIGQSFSLR